MSELFATYEEAEEALALCQEIRASIGEQGRILARIDACFDRIEHLIEDWNKG